MSQDIKTTHRKIITGHRPDDIKDVMKTIIDTYNNSSHRTLNNKSLTKYLKTMMTKWSDTLTTVSTINQHINLFHLTQGRR
jgi:hypothetical protein